LSDLLGLFVQHPGRLLAVGAAFVVLWGSARVLTGRPGRALLVPAAFFAAFAAWEWLVMTRSPEANIRVDLLLIWPAAVIVTAWSVYRAVRR
jgi:hypothetical protein